MPFLDDSGPRPEKETSLLWRSTALIADQLERMIALNLAWALQLAPLAAAVLLPLPAWARILLVTCSVFTLIPATAALFYALNQSNQGAPISAELVLEGLRRQFRPAFLKLLPLYSLFYWLGLLAWAAAQNNWLWLDVLARLSLLLLAVVALHWGGLFTRQPHLTALQIFTWSVKLTWRKPALTLLAGFYTLAALLLGIISIGGIVLIIPALVALVQIQLSSQTMP